MEQDNVNLKPTQENFLELITEIVKEYDRQALIKLNQFLNTEIEQRSLNIAKQINDNPFINNLPKEYKNINEFENLLKQITINNSNYRLENFKNYIDQKTYTKSNRPTLKDFFNPEVKQSTIDNIQEAFKNESGKNMAIIVFLLEMKYKLITIYYKGSSKSRQSFIEALKEVTNYNKKMWAINKNFRASTNYLDDAIFYSGDFKILNSKLSAIISRQ